MNFFTNLLEVSRLALSKGTTHNGQRDLYEIFGYKLNPTYKDFYDKYERQDIAARIVESYPDSCWCHPPTIQNDPEVEDRNAWEASVDELLENLDFWNVIYKADILAQIGNYSLIYIGFADNKEPKDPVNKGAKPTFLMPMSEDLVEIDKIEKEITNPRFGKPLTYKVKIEGGQHKEIHHSRVIHIAERSVGEDHIGSSILKRIYNRLDDLEKVVGSAAEVWWLNARGGLSLEVDADATIDDPEAMAKAVDEYQHKLSRMIKTKGIEVKPITHEVPKPKEHFEIIISTISGATGIPQRILIGSERGQLASSQDDENWNDRIDQRRVKFCVPEILNAFIDKMILLGVIKPNDYEWDWPCLDSLSEIDAADVASKKAGALAAYANSPSADSIVGHRQFVEEVLNLDYKEDEVEEMIEEEDAEIAESEKL